MSKFDEYRTHAENAITACLDLVATARNNDASKDQTPFIMELVQTKIGPLSNFENILNVPVLEGKPDWRKNALEFVFRDIAHSLVNQIPETDGSRFPRLFDCLDMVLAATKLDYLENVIPLTLIEELFDVHTISGCEKLFEYIEKRKAQLTANMVPGKGKGLVMLRMCNEMLRRLSKETNTVFCGRILMFLANSFPLGERSGVNLRGDFNSEPVHYDSDEQVDADETMTDEQKQFYKLFWNTRKYFSNPPTIFQGDNFSELQKGSNAILEKFKQISSQEKAITGESVDGGEHPGMKRKRSLGDMEEDDAAELLKEINSAYQFPRLLSSRRLLELEIEDARFRRNVIVQFLILFQYLYGFTPEEKEKTQQLLATRGATKQSLVQPAYVLTEEQAEWVSNTREEMLALLKLTKPHGELYTDIVMTILRHEHNWIIWKASGCPAFEKPAIDEESLKEIWSRKKPRLTMVPGSYRFIYGSSELTSMYGQQRAKLSEFMKSRPKPPKPLLVVDETLERLENEKDMPIEQQYKLANGAVFQATRLLFNTHATLIHKVYNAKKEIYKALKDSGKSSEEKEEEDTTKVVLDPTNVTEQLAEAEIKVLKATREIIASVQ